MAGEAEHDPLVVPEYDDGEIVGVLPDGSGHLVRLPGSGKPVYATRTADDIVGWRSRCSCGSWQSDRFHRVARATDEDLSERRVFGGSDPAAVARRPDVIAAATTSWERGHRAVVLAVASVADARHDVDRALLALDEAVAAARLAGATWDSIGSAAGMTRQSAHTRWSRRGGREALR